MIYAFFGTDTEKVRAKAHAWIEASRGKDENLTYARMTEDSFNEKMLLESLGGQSLFAKRTLMSLDGVCATQEEFIMRHLSDLAASENVFAIIEGRLSSKTVQEIEKVATKTFSFDTKKEQHGPNFKLWNAIDRRDGVGAWVEYQKERRQGAATEMLVGFIHSKVRKNMQKDSRWRIFSRRCIAAYHEARKGNVDLDESFEWLLLSLSAH